MPCTAIHKRAPAGVLAFDLLHDGDDLRGKPRIALVPRFDPPRSQMLSSPELRCCRVARCMPSCSSTSKAGRPLTAPGLRYISAGGSPSTLIGSVPSSAAGLPLNNGYGLTECSSNVAITRVNAARDDDSVGFPLPGVEIALSVPMAWMLQMARSASWIRAPICWLAEGWPLGPAGRASWLSSGKEGP